MEKSTLLRAARLATLGLLPVLAACNNDNDGDPVNPANPVELKAHSVTPNLVKALPGFESLQDSVPRFRSDDVLAESPASSSSAPSPMGPVCCATPPATATCSSTTTKFPSRCRGYTSTRRSSPPRASSIVTATAAPRACARPRWPRPKSMASRCPLSSTAGESGAESMVHAIDPLGPQDKANSSRRKPALGKASMENAVPLEQGRLPRQNGYHHWRRRHQRSGAALRERHARRPRQRQALHAQAPQRRPGGNQHDHGHHLRRAVGGSTGAKTLTGAQIAAFSVSSGALQPGTG
ncbi:MAG: hypothetical protein WKG07_06880 [Hymenobacter sp.]